MATVTKTRRQAAPIRDSRKRASLLIRDLSDEKVKVVLPFLEFLRFVDQNGENFDVNTSLKQGITEIVQFRAGKTKPKSFEALLNEL